MAKTFYEAIIAQGGFAGQSFDINLGPVQTDVIDVLLSASGGTNASFLQTETPVNLTSTGALGGPREVDLSGIEDPGRFFFLSVRNSDISAINALTITATTDINGFGTSLALSTASDLLFVHETGGMWRAYEQTLQGIDSNIARVFRADFLAATWDAGAIDNQIVIIQTGIPGAGELGPHGLQLADSYIIQVFRDSDDQQVEVGVRIDGITGDITLTKAGLGQDFAGRVIVIGD